MSSEIATLDSVKAAVDMIRRHGDRPTADRVIGLIGGGSKSTVLHHLRTLRDGSQDERDLPASVLEAIRPAIEQVFQAGRATENEKLRAATERLALIVEDQDAQVAELVEENAQLRQQSGEALKQAREAREEAGRNKEQVDRLVEEKRALEDRLVLARETAAGELRDTLARMEGMLAKVGGNG